MNYCKWVGSTDLMFCLLTRMTRILNLSVLNRVPLSMTRLANNSQLCGFATQETSLETFVSHHSLDMGDRGEVCIRLWIPLLHKESARFLQESDLRKHFEMFLTRVVFLSLLLLISNWKVFGKWGSFTSLVHFGKVLILVDSS